MASVIKSSGNVVVLGLAEVRARMLALPRRLGINVVRRGLLAGAGVIRDEARLRAPQPPGKSKRGGKRTGKLAKSIVAASKMVKGSKGQKYEAVVSIRKPNKPKDADFTDAELAERASKGGGPNPRAYAHLVEYGTRPHATGKGSDLEINVRGKAIGRGRQRGAMHPGNPPQPFMRPAFDLKKVAAVQAFTDVLKRELGKEIQKLAGEKSPKDGGKAA